LDEWADFYSELEQKESNQAETIARLEAERTRLAKVVEGQRGHLLQQERETRSQRGKLQAFIEESATQRTQLARANADRQRLSERLRGTAILAKQEVLESMVPTFDLVRSALPHRDVDEVHARIRASLERFEDLGVQVGRPPDAKLSATEAARLIRRSKRKLQDLDPRDLPYEVRGHGKQRQHRVYRLRDCLTFMTREKKGGA
jgi:chromosome segregation ATPase